MGGGEGDGESEVVIAGELDCAGVRGCFMGGGRGRVRL